MESIQFYLQGKSISAVDAKMFVDRRAAMDLWEPGDIDAIWSRLIDVSEVYEERLECSETVFTICQGDLEILLPEPA